MKHELRITDKGGKFEVVFKREIRSRLLAVNCFDVLNKLNNLLKEIPSEQVQPKEKEEKENG